VDVKEKNAEERRQILIKGKSGQEAKFKISPIARFRFKAGQHVAIGDQLTEGSIDPRELLSLVGVEKTARYLVQEVQKVYRSQGVDINVKHIEMIIRQMFKKVRVVDPGDTTFFTDQVVSRLKVLRANTILLAQGRQPAEFNSLLQGVGAAAFDSEGFLSAASSRETPRVLSDAAIKGKIDRLTGLKEAVIVGEPIPAGTASPELLLEMSPK
jgi:DNA-directed RNA polymerase subunit beta'